MELRSGTVVASGGGFASAEAARAACLGQARVQLPPAALPTFASGVRGVLARWTALRLAREHGWGGDDTDAKAATLEEAVLGWFCAKGACRAVCCCGKTRWRLTPSLVALLPGDHYADELEDHLTEYLEEDFHIEAEDGSPGEARARCVAHLRQRRLSHALSLSLSLRSATGCAAAGPLI